jgi:capsular exopolysaccharide synthesis family protein
MNSTNTRALLNDIKDESTVDLRQVFINILNNWPWILLSTIFMVALGIMYNRYVEPVFSAKSAILVKDEKKGGAGLLDNPLLKDLQLGDGGKLVDNEVEVLHSYDLMDATVRKGQLFLDIKREGKFTSRSIFGDEFPLKVRIANPDTISNSFTWEVVQRKSDNKWWINYKDKENVLPVTMGKWYSINGVIFQLDHSSLYSEDTSIVSSNINSGHTAAPENKYLFKFYSVNSTVNAYLAALNVKAVNKTASIISLELTDHNPKRAKETLSALISTYKLQGLEDQKQISRNTLEFLNGRLAIIERELQTVEGQVERFQTNNKITDIPAEGQIYLDQAKDIDQQKAQQETQLNILESLETSLQNNQDNGKMVTSASGILEPSLAALIQSYNQLVLERERQTTRLGPKNPITVDVANQVKNTRESLVDNITSLKKAYRITLDNINKKDAELSMRIKSMPTIQKNLVQIKRDQSVKEQLYFFLLQKKEEAAITLASITADSRSIEQARSTGMVSPKKQLVLAISVLLGIFLPAAIIYIRSLLDNKIGDKEEVEQSCNAPVLGEISYAKKEKSPIVIERGSRSIIAEQFRVIRTNVGFTRSDGKEPRVVLITSHRPAEGKSFVSLNLAASFALLDKKVVVLEFDLRKPRLSSALKVVSEKGISNFLSNASISLDNLLYEVPDFNGNFSLLPAGPIPPNPAELILGPRMKIMMDELKEKFDYVILDTPPYSLVTDSSLLGVYADANIVVLRHKFTFKFVLKELNKKIRENPSRGLYTIINRVGEGRGYMKYKSYKSYGFSEYFDEPEKRRKGIAGWFKKRNR